MIQTSKATGPVTTKCSDARFSRGSEGMAKTIQKMIEGSNNHSLSKGRNCRGPQDLSRLELQCMRVIWMQKATTVLEVQRSLEPRRPLAYTTVLTILGRLAQKGAVQRVKKGKTYIYKPALSLIESRDMALRELIEFYFEGSSQKLMNHLTGEEQRSAIPSQLPLLKSTRANSPEINDCLL